MRCYKILSFLFFISSTLSAQQVAHLLYTESTNGEGVEGIVSINETFDGGYILGIGTNSTTVNINASCAQTGERFVFRKFNNSNILEWEKCSPTGWYTSMYPTSNGNYCYIGTKLSIDRAFVAKTEDANGNVIWSRNYGGSGDEFLRDVIATDDGGYVLFGETSSGDGDIPPHPANGPFQENLWVVKINSSGSIVWSKVIGGTDTEDAAAIIHGPDGGFYIIGSTTSNNYDCDCTKHPGQYTDAFLARLDSNGNMIWKRCMGTDAGARGVDIAADGYGGVYVVNTATGSGGDVNGFIGGNDFWVLRVDSANNVIWNKCYGSPKGHEDPKAICVATDGTIWISGKTHASGSGGDVYASYGPTDAWIINIDINGNFLKSKVLGAVSVGVEMTHIYPLSNGMIVTGGIYTGSGPAGGEFPSYYGGGYTDALLAFIAPWTVSINEVLSQKNKPAIYPNPVADVLNIANQSAEEQFVQVRDITGRIIYDTKSRGNIVLNVSNWTSGMYVVNVVDANGTQYKQKITKY